jgi:accessory gene regulator protein AgrB
MNPLTSKKNAWSYAALFFLCIGCITLLYVMLVAPSRQKVHERMDMDHSHVRRKHGAYTTLLCWGLGAVLN